MRWDFRLVRIWPILDDVQCACTRLVFTSHLYIQNPSPYDRYTKLHIGSDRLHLSSIQIVCSHIVFEVYPFFELLEGASDPKYKLPWNAIIQYRLYDDIPD